jgi:Uma2 family endonuclease
MSRVSLPTTRFTADEFVRLVEADAFGTNRVELLNGRIHFMPAQAVPHMAAITKGSIALSRIASVSDWVVTQGTLPLNRYNMPDPDLMLLPVPIGSPAHEWTLPVLLIEISDTTYRKDSGVKLRKYAQHGVHEYWIENLQKNRIEVYRQPQNLTGQPRDWSYASVQHFTRGQTIELSHRPGVTLTVEELLP